MLPLLVCLVVMAVCPAPACNQGFTGANEATAVNQPDKMEATFEVGALTILPATPMVGDAVGISAIVENTGDVAGMYTVLLTIDEQEVDQEQVAVEPASSSTVVFQVGNLSAGYHEIDIDGARKSVTVYDWRPYTINYCKGQSDWVLFTGEPGTMYGSGDLGQIVHFALPSSPFKIQQIRIKGEVTTENQLELDARYFTVRIWSRDRTQRLWSAEFPWRIFDNSMSWRTIDVPDIRVEDDFYVEVVADSDAGNGNGAGNYLAIAFEIARDALPEPRSLEYYRKSAYDSHSGWSVNGQPTEPPGREISLNWCIRVDGMGRL